MDLLRMEHLTKIYGKGENEVRALDDVSFTVPKGQMAAIIGPSGSGKSTLLHIIGAVDRPTSGKVFLNDQDVFAQKDERLAIFRRREVGLILALHFMNTKSGRIILFLRPCSQVDLVAAICRYS